MTTSSALWLALAAALVLMTGFLLRQRTPRAAGDTAPSALTGIRTVTATISLLTTLAIAGEIRNRLPGITVFDITAFAVASILTGVFLARIRPGFSS